MSTLLPEYKEYLVKKTANKFNLSIGFAETFIDVVEENGHIKGFEEVLEKSDRYSQLYDHYFGRRNKFARIEVK